MENMTITPEVVKEQGLSQEEYRKICDLLKREPNFTELGLFSAMWSEHCSYKNSKPVLKLFHTKGKQVIQGPGENAGVVDIGDGLAACFKIESHNHPSAVEPYEASATGGGGCVRDVFTMGARPVALLDSLRLGNLSDEKVKFLFKEIIRGFTDHANVLGIPVVGGEIYFDECYEGNPLVNAMTVGILQKKNLMKARASGVGNLVLIVGGPTGRDGVAGASFASGGLDENAEKKKSAVAIGDAKMGRILCEACLELIESNLAVGMQDMGAAGLVCSTSETAYKAGLGIEIDISQVPRKEEGMTPYEVMLSESQERMLVIVEKKNLENVKKIFSKWNVPVAVIGKVTDDGILNVKEKDKVVASVPAKLLVETPVYHREEKKPAYLNEAGKLDLQKVKEPADLNEALLRLLAVPTISSKWRVYGKGDPKNAGDVITGPGSDSAVVAVPGTKKALALTTDCNARYCYLDPYRGGQIAVAEAARNLVCSGAKPLAITDGLNFGNPMDPGIFWQFKQAVLGISEACKVLDTPVVSGNVSFHNENPGGSVDPTPIVGMVGLIEDVSKAMTQSFKKEADRIILLGENKHELGGSEYLKAIHNLKKGEVPGINLESEKYLQKCCLEIVKNGFANSLHDCSEGGFAVALAECCISGKKKKFGARVDFSDTGIRGDALLFGESQSRIIVSCSPANAEKIKKIAAQHNVSLRDIGEVGAKELIIKNNGKTLIASKIEELDEAWRGCKFN